jgi:integrase
MKAPVPRLRGQHYEFRRRVPGRYASIEQRVYIQQCLFTDSFEIAKRKAAEVWARLIDAWEAKLDGNESEGDERMAAAMNLAKRRGYRYMDVAQVAKLPIEELLKRVESVVDKRSRLDMKEADAVLGIVPRPSLKVSQSLNQFYEIAGDRLVGKNADQLRRHKAPRLRAIKNFIEGVGDKPLAEITTDDMFQFRAHWLKRVQAGEVEGHSANKDFTYLNAMWTAVARAKGIDLQYSMDGIAFHSVKTKGQVRPPFSDDWIKEKLLAPGALMAMNTDARLILLGMVNTGYRPSEGAGLLPDEIRLEGKVPHIIIQPNGNRALKNSHSERYIPLTGVSLDAFREAKLGFPRYAKNSASLSATVNKFLDENRLLQTKKHSLYSLRHSFEDRMLEGGVDERIRSDLMGHGIKRERYGKGGDMEHVRKLMLPLAL